MVVRHRVVSLSLSLSLSLIAACNSAATKPPAEAGPPAVAAPASATSAPPAAPTAATPTPAAAPSSADRRKDPAFALREVNGAYVGRVADQCPWGSTSRDATHIVPPIEAKNYKVVGDKLEIQLPYGGCPLWAGYTVVTGHGSPLPFYVCHEIQHDTCEMDGMKTWVFDLSKELRANNATAVAFGVPTGVY